MKRRNILASLAALLGLGAARVGISAREGMDEVDVSTFWCNHEWVKGPYYVSAAIHPEETRYFSPHGAINIEHCIRCGLLRLSKKDRKVTEPYLA